MKTNTYKQCILCAGETMAESVEAFNKEMQRLGHLNPTYERIDGGFLIYYSETSMTPEGLADEMELSGCRHTCEECDYCTWPTNRFGEEDGRVKKTLCDRAGRLVRKNTPACDTFYEEGQHKRLFLDNYPRGEDEKIRA